MPRAAQAALVDSSGCDTEQLATPNVDNAAKAMRETCDETMETLLEDADGRQRMRAQLQRVGIVTISRELDRVNPLNHTGFEQHMFSDLDLVFATGAVTVCDDCL